jgi:hypothetical protein
MCPECLATIGSMAAGLVSSGGLAALMVSVRRGLRTAEDRTDLQIQNRNDEGETHGAAENRDAR